MGYLDGFLVTLRQHRLFGGNQVTQSYSGGRVAKRKTDDAEAWPARDFDDDDKAAKPERLHGRHVLGRYEDGMEKCIGCELCAGVCPAKCIYVRGADNDPDNPTAPGERFGFVYEINYLRCIHCDLCVEACPTEAITESKLFEFSFTSRQDAIYTKTELLVGDDGKPQRLAWEDWRAGEDEHTSGWMRATSPSGSADYVGEVGWSSDLGYGVRPAEQPDSPDSIAPASASPARSTNENEPGVASASEQPDASASELSDTASEQPDASASELSDPEASY